MSDGTVIVGGAYFTDPRIGFDIRGDWQIQNILAEDILHNHFYRGLPDNWFFVFGIKRWTRRLKKAGIKYKYQPIMIVNYLKKIIPANAPMGILDDCNLDDENGVGECFRRLVFGYFNCKIYLLREYLKNKNYDKRVIPFSIPCKDYKQYHCKKNRDLYFYGNDSHKCRKRVVKKLKDLNVDSRIVLYKDGEKAPEKKPYEEFISELAQSRTCIALPGAGYCTFRYQEIPSSGSLLVAPNTPWVVRNDYTSSQNCFKFDHVSQIAALYKVHSDRNEDWSAEGYEHFLKYHTTEVRNREWRGFLDEVRRD